MAKVIFEVASVDEPRRGGRQPNFAGQQLFGQRVVTASGDLTARVWNAVSGKPIGEPMKHGDEVYYQLEGEALGSAGEVKVERPLFSAQFSPDGQRVVIASGERSSVAGTGQARIWDVPTTRSQDTRDDVLLLAEFAEAASGSVLQTSGQAEILKHLPLDQMRAAREKIAAKDNLWN